MWVLGDGRRAKIWTYASFFIRFICWKLRPNVVKWRGEAWGNLSLENSTFMNGIRAVIKQAEGRALVLFAFYPSARDNTAFIPSRGLSHEEPSHQTPNRLSPWTLTSQLAELSEINFYHLNIRHSVSFCYSSKKGLKLLDGDSFY
jgi:hypothetical protein